MKVIIILLISVVVTISVGKQVSYDGYQVFRVTANNVKQLEVLQHLQHSEFFDFWSAPRIINKPVDVMVSPQYQNTFKLTAYLAGLSITVLVENVESTVIAERINQASASRDSKISFTRYHRYADILDYVRQEAQLQPTRASTETIGTSYEGRDLEVIRICKDGCGRKPVVLIDCGIHAREWIAPAMCLYIVERLMLAESDPLLEETDVFLIPVLNPDGYEYSHTNERFWRKTRSPGSLCHGTDGNRNFDFHWMEVGASQNECSEVYAGKVPFSEPEFQVLRDFVLANRDSIKMYLTFHSYGQYLLYPWGYTSSMPSDWQELQSLGEDVDAAIQKVAGTKYTVGSVTNALYPSAGGSDDWAKGVGGIELTYTVELPGGGQQGFDLPPSRILPVAQETWQGVKVFMEYVAQKFARQQ